MKLQLRLAVTALALAFTNLVSAATIVETGTGGAIPATGTSGSSFFDIAIGDSGTITDITVRLLGFGHAQVGDVRLTLNNVEDGVSRDLIYRVGASGGTGGGDNSNLGGDYAFNDAYTANVWTAAGNANGTNTIVPVGNYFASTIDGVSVSLLSGFGGLDAAGTWRLTVSDLVHNNSGYLAQWQLELATDDSLVTSTSSGPSPVPEPTTCLLLSLGLTALAFCRKRH